LKINTLEKILKLSCFGMLASSYKKITEAQDITIDYNIQVLLSLFANIAETDREKNNA
jgi:hypothetical protein